MALRPAWTYTGPPTSSSPLLYVGVYIKRVVDVGEGDFKWAFIVAPANQKPDSKCQKYWMAKVRDFTGLTNVYGCKEGTLIDPRDEKDLLCRILLAEVEDLEKLHKVMCLPRSPKTIMEDVKWESMCWVRGMLGKLMNEGCLKRGLVAWDVVVEEGLEMAESRVRFNGKNYPPTVSYTWIIDLRNREESNEWRFRKSESPELEDHASFVKRMNAYWDDDSPTSESSRIDDEGGTDRKGPDPSPSLVPSKKPRPRGRAREVVTKGKRTEAAGVTETAPSDCPPSSRAQPRAPVVVPSQSKSGFGDSNTDAEHQAKSLSKSPKPFSLKTPPDYPVGHDKQKRLVDPDSPSPVSRPQVPASKRM